MVNICAFRNVPGLQVYVVILAERFVPSAVDVVSAFNIAPFNAGIAIDSYFGGLITDSTGLIHTSWIGALMVLLTAILGLVELWNERISQKTLSKKIGSFI